MMSLEAIRVVLLLTVAFFATLGFTAPNPVPAPADITPPPRACIPNYNITKFTLDFEEIGPPCYMVCPTFARYNVSSFRGQGVAYTKWGSMERPLLIPNLSAWQVINCTSVELANQQERYACTNNSVRAFYSPGKSPWDGSKPRLNTIDFPETYFTGALESLNITPLRLPAGTKKATLELTGIKVNGRQVTHKVDLDIKSGKKQFYISNLKAAGFVDLKVIEFWLIVGNVGGYEFALDNLNLEEYRPLPGPPSCTPTPTPVPDTGNCIPPPTKTTWTANAEEFKTSTSIPTPYHSLTWNTYTTVLNTSTFANQYFWPRGISGVRGNFYQAYSPFQISSYQYEYQFGVESLSVACAFREWEDPDPLGTNNGPCTLSFVGRRDPYDGDGLPSLVIYNYTIPNPGRDATTQKFTKINLSQLTNSPGKFTRLYAFTILARVGSLGGFSYETQVLLDDIVLTRGAPLDKKCRVRGWKEINFDDIRVGSQAQKLPSLYQDFKFSDNWRVNKRSNYAPGTLGYQSVISQPNVGLTGWTETPDEIPGSSSIDSYINPAKNFLFDFEEVTFTINLPEYATDKSILKDVRININVLDACGSGHSYGAYVVERNPFWGTRSFAPVGDKLTFTYSEPIRATSLMWINAWISRDNGRNLQVYVDNFRYRKYTGPTPGCRACGRRGGDSCEVPEILPR